MGTFTRIAAALMLGAIVFSPSAVRSQSTDELLAAIEAANPTLETYRASIQFSVGLHWPVPLRKTLHGDTYFKRPSKMEVVFADLPGYAQQFRQLYVGLGTPQEWSKKYEIASAVADGHDYLVLTPKKSKRLRRIDVYLDEISRLPVRVLWTYRDGSIDMKQKIVKIDANYVVGEQHAEIRLPGVSAWVESNLKDYAFNVPVDDAVFTKKPDPAT